MHCSGGLQGYLGDWGPKCTHSPGALWGQVEQNACKYSPRSSDAGNSNHLFQRTNPIFQVVCAQNRPQPWSRPSYPLSLPAESITQKTSEYPSFSNLVLIKNTNNNSVIGKSFQWGNQAEFVYHWLEMLVNNLLFNHRVLERQVHSSSPCPTFSGFLSQTNPTKVWH